MAFTISRRALFAGAAGTAGAFAAVAAGVATFDLNDLMRRTLTRLLGEFDISDEDLATFAKDFSRLVELDGETGLMLRTASFTGVSSILSNTGPHFTRNRFEGFDRTVLATFITTTNYLDIYKSGQGRVVYHGIEPPCVSPFAHFEFP
ncbi:hypothetical protein [Rhizorhapis suberifaciens]|uniref:Twin-arginine translocation pathway signal n=1 Tax=Rhizorhapis suberifaciens TaxID=13656 RepID=A0A840HVT6_9SPHN|nr:hypothetical protein [Rhizorhapis suberifaciens]MBB4642402.1 hypothetical protein [Rhizorhapis suberifaciens]